MQGSFGLFPMEVAMPHCRGASKRKKTKFCSKNERLIQWWVEYEPCTEEAFKWTQKRPVENKTNIFGGIAEKRSQILEINKEKGKIKYQEKSDEGGAGLNENAGPEKITLANKNEIAGLKVSNKIKLLESQIEVNIHR